ncbi:rhomboid-like protein, putative [Trypanosoma brucei gambiense DAL972]|uniref:Rhomboid-like protein, putative n=2 Tax=Trypanosoma brucei TaxID=5691 RepID=C9ZUV6_TRYB9|nr:rhomboid-like protein, putative [Trypanosoma brucei gambiense DAL972]RHW70982.1 rhomboid-like protein [Trypanosoma brucei equiperdum]CBH13194.1 rhomboid-like protein, putative [Trypanosoma brucei gambiense DAL972]|eukprot:XP_011775471.1 rhomboid-like protein, putative [Trypanosoma brucei gambiense DAL972]
MAGEGAVSGAVAAVLCGTALLSTFSTVVPRVLGFIPAHTFSARSYPWNLITYVVVETNIVLAVCSAVYMLTFGVAVESIIGTRALVRLIAASTVSASLTLLILSALLYNVGFTWFLQCYCGVWPAASGILVPWVGVSPRSPAFPSQLPRQVQRQHVPTALLAITLVIDWLFRGQHRITENDVGGTKVFLGSVFTPALLGLLTTWYLQSALNTPSVVPLSVLLEPLLKLCGMVSKAPRQQGSGDGSRAGSGSGGIADTVAVPVLQGAAAGALLPGSTEDEAQRRRNIALAALSSRIQQTTADTAATQHDAAVV